MQTTNNNHNLNGTLSNCCSAPHAVNAEFSILNERAIGICSECHHPAEFTEQDALRDGDDMSEFVGDQMRDDSVDDDQYGFNREPREDNFRDDVEADADVLASAGYGTDEDYGYFGEDNDWE